jgi:hypothetical protein
MAGSILDFEEDCWMLSQPLAISQAGNGVQGGT